MPKREKSRKMKLSQLLETIDEHDEWRPFHHIEVNGIATNSKLIQQNDLFIAISGYRHDGHQFIPEAVKAGAAAVIGEKDLRLRTIPYMKAENSRKALARLAKAYYRPPLEKKSVDRCNRNERKNNNMFYD